MKSAAQHPVSGEVLTAFNVAQRIESYRIRFATEADVQLAIDDIFHRAGYYYEREYRLSAQERPDFLVSASHAPMARTKETIAVEVKIKGRASDIIRQLTRYAMHARVHGLVLVTTRRLHAARMPTELNGKPLAVAMIGGL